MINKLIGFWSDESGLKSIFSSFNEMLITAKVMFEKSTTYLFDKHENTEAESRELVKLDGQINALQQTIRRDIVIHVTVYGAKDMLPCLLLMSLVKDAERLGDYAKNIMEVADRFNKFEKKQYFERLKKMREDILRWFDETKNSFENVDAKHAQKTREDAYRSEKECDRIAWDLMINNNKPDAVALALLFRFFKRISAHLGNICTSVVMPLDKLDYFDKPEL